jgi:hypothetical protein
MNSKMGSTKNVPVVKEEEEEEEVVGNVSGTLSFEPITKPVNSPKKVNRNLRQEDREKETFAPSPLNSFSSPKNGTKTAKLSKDDLESIGALTSTTAITDMPAIPPSTDSDVISNIAAAPRAQSGGNLYAAISRSAYQLAPAAVLLGIASGTIKRKTRRMKAKKSSTHKKTMRRRR